MSNKFVEVENVALLLECSDEIAFDLVYSSPFICDENETDEAL